MKHIAIETGSSNGSIALLENDNLLQLVPFTTNIGYGKELFPSLETLLNNHHLILNDIKLLSVNKGPGSYTGLRMGVTCINTLSWANQIPSLGISFLYAMATKSSLEGNMTCVFYANPKECFTAKFEKKENHMTQIAPDSKIMWQNLNLPSQTQVLFYSPRGDSPPNNIITSEVLQPQADFIGISAFHLFNRGTKLEMGTIIPNYLKDFEATVKQ